MNESVCEVSVKPSDDVNPSISITLLTVELVHDAVAENYELKLEHSGEMVKEVKASSDGILMYILLYWIS